MLLLLVFIESKFKLIIFYLLTQILDPNIPLDSFRPLSQAMYYGQYILHIYNNKYHAINAVIKI